MKFLTLIYLILFSVLAAASTTWYFVPPHFLPNVIEQMPTTMTHNCGAYCYTFSGGCDISTTYPQSNHILACPTPTPVPTPVPSPSP